MTSVTEPPSYDLTTVPPMGGYPAKQCPVHLQYNLFPPLGAAPLPDSPAMEARKRAGNEFEDEVFGQLLATHPQAMRLDTNARGASDRTLRAMAEGAPLILGGVLPTDREGRRTGRPDILLRHKDGYLPLDVKHHTLARDHDESEGSERSSLESPFLVDRHPTSAKWNSSLRGKDALQLAHYWRMLEALGHQASGPAYGGILDRSRNIWWLRLDDPTSTPARWRGGRASWLEKYDHEFGFRLDVAAHTLLRRSGEVDLPRKVLPVWTSECTECVWRAECKAELETTDHVSLLPETTWWDYRELRTAGHLTRRAIASLDPRTARLLRDLPTRSIERLEAAQEDEELSGVLGRSASAVGLIAQCKGEGITTAGVLRSQLDPETMQYAGKASKLPRLIEQARAAVAGTPLRREHASDVPKFVVEVDFDMESTEDGFYMWGAVPCINGDVGRYEPFDTYAPMTDELEALVFLQFLDRLSEWRAEARRLCGSLGLFHWSHAELSAMRSIARKSAVPGLPSTEEIEALIREECIDLEGVFKRQVVVGHGTGLKTIAPITGFRWDVDDPGGDISMEYYRKAVSAPVQSERDAAIEWLRSYNASDVRATFEIRAWLRHQVPSLPTVDDWAGV